MKNYFEILCLSLGFFARMAGGYATVIDYRSGRKKTVDSSGKEVLNYPLEEYEGLEDARQKDQPSIVHSRSKEGIVNFFLPMGDCLLAVNNFEHVRKEMCLKENFIAALPLIARVAGGEAVLFDHQGMRFYTVGPDGRESKRGKQEYTYLGREAMESGKPVIGPSLLEEGALAIRMPITESLGMGFNNVLSVRQKKILAGSGRNNPPRYTFDSIIGTSKAIQRCIKLAHQVALSNSTVLIYGETGTGKEIFAQSIHNASPRANGPFVAINCGAIPASLVESQLFGYEGGAFTGALKEGQPGLFEQAIGGTIFLDEISEMEMEMQSRLLRVLQEREVMRIGGKKRIPVDLRVIASTNKDLVEMVRNGKFREDLFYRLNVVDLNIPPLRERKEDILLLARYFIQQLRSTYGIFIRDISSEAIEYLMRYNWPGNVRELQNCIERIANFTTHEVIQPEDLPVSIKDTVHRLARLESGNRIMQQAWPMGTVAGSIPRDALQNTLTSEYSLATPDSLELKKTTHVMERAAILQALQETGYKRSRAAKKLGISTTTLWRKMKMLGLLDEINI